MKLSITGFAPCDLVTFEGTLGQLLDVAARLKLEDLRAGMDDEIRSIWPTNKISAIRRCREITGWGLKEAKDYCERLTGSSVSS